MSGGPSLSVQSFPNVESLESRLGPGPSEVRSSLTEEELGLVRARFFFPPEFVLETAGPEDRITCPPEGRVGVYVETLRAGLRFPLHGFVNELLEAYNLVPAQLAPNSWRLIIGFLSLCVAHKILVSVRVFRGCFMLKSSPAMRGWLYFAFRGGKLLFKGMPSSIHGWKEKYLFVSSRLPWGFDPTWDVPRMRENNLLPVFTDVEEEALRALQSLEGEVHLRDLLSEDALVNVGLSPAPPEGTGRRVACPFF